MDIATQISLLDKKLNTSRWCHKTEAKISLSRCRKHKTVDQKANIMSRPEQEQADETPRLNKLNWLNLGFYVLNLAITYGVGTLGWLGNGNNSELSEKYQVR
jgi:hypothetical protein